VGKTLWILGCLGHLGWQSGCASCSETEPVDSGTEPTVPVSQDSSTLETGATGLGETATGETGESAVGETGETAAPPISGTPLPDGTRHAMWVWAGWDGACLTPSGAICYGGETDCTTSDGASCTAPATVWFDPAQGSELVAAAAHNGVSRLLASTYYPRGRIIETDQGTFEALLYADAELGLVADAQALGVAVWAMSSFGGGDVDYVGFPDEHAGGTNCDPEAVNEPLHRVLDILRFNQSQAGFAFDGLFIDLEPDIDGLASDEASTDQDIATLRGVLDVLACAKALVGASELPLGAIVNWRWDATLEYQGKTASMATHLYELDLEFYVVVPYYHQVDVLLDRAALFLDDADAAGVRERVAVATETQDCTLTSACDEATTFFACGHWGYVTVLQDLAAALAGGGGIVTHAYDKAYLSDEGDWPAQAVLEGDWPDKPAACDPD
jgi:hypothetical protein